MWKKDSVSFPPSQSRICIVLFHFYGELFLSDYPQSNYFEQNSYMLCETLPQDSVFGTAFTMQFWKKKMKECSTRTLLDQVKSLTHCTIFQTITQQMLKESPLAAEEDTYVLPATALLKILFRDIPSSHTIMFRRKRTNRRRISHSRYRLKETEQSQISSKCFYLKLH